MLRLFGVSVLICAALPAAVPPDPSLLPAGAALARVPLRFEENRGQWDSKVRYMARSASGDLQLTARGAAFRVGSAPVGITFVHSAGSPSIEPLDPQATRTNYMIGPRSQWHTGVANYGRVRYHGVYPGIDVLYYGNNRQLEYDFELAPGADPEAIRLQIRGDVQLSLTASGDLSIKSGDGEAIQKAPVLFQDSEPVRGHYTLLGAREVGFAVEAFDRSKPLVIDPLLIYCTYVGGSLADRITGMKMGPGGRLYISGYTPNDTMGQIDGAYDQYNAGGVDMFLAIIDTTDGNYTMLYLSYLGGSGNDYPNAMAVDPNGVAYLVGSTTSLNFPMTGNSFQTTGISGTQDGVVAVLDPSLTGTDALIYSTYFGGTAGVTVINDVDLDSAGFIYLIGTTRSSDFPCTDNAYNKAGMWGTQDAFLAKLDRNTNALPYSTYLGGELSDEGRAIKVGTDGKVYFGVSTASTQFPLEGVFYRGTLHGEIGIVVGKMDFDLYGIPSLVFSTYFGGPHFNPNLDHTGHTDDIRRIALDSNNNIILAGYTLSPDFDVTPDAVQRNQQGNGDAFVAIVNPNDPVHFLKYSTLYGGSGGEVAYDVVQDASGNLYLTGYSLSPDLFIVDAAYGWGGGISAFLAKIKPYTAGRAGLLLSTYFGATGTYVGTNLTLGEDGAVYLAGYGNTGLPITTGGFHGGMTDGFLMVLK
jgi:hypothetical protein